MTYFETVALWLATKRQIAELQATERQLRAGLFSGAFPDPQEGTNTYPLPPGKYGSLELPEGAMLKGTYKLSRKVLKPKLEELRQKDPQRYEFACTVLRFNPELELKSYRLLASRPDAKESAILSAVHSVLEVKPATPELKLHLPGQKSDGDEDE
jgi:hypothetical protein